MKEEYRKLLLKDLSARVPYGVKYIKYSWDYDHDQEIPEVEVLECVDKNGYISHTKVYTVEDIKPYLFPLSSMTEEQFNELKSYVNLKYEHNTLELVEWDNNYKTLEFWLEEIPSYHVIKVFDWLNKNHFDYRGLISMELANDATELNIY